jgi:hypothetical protein
METFNPHSQNPARAKQMWQILVGKAMNRQTVTYPQLSVLMYGKEMPSIMASILGHIYCCCKEEGLPPLTTIVVSEITGQPQWVSHDAETLCRQQTDVFSYDWYDVVPPEELDFAEAYAKHH